MIKLILIGSALIFLNGCASIGSGEFGCSGIPNGTRCSKTSELYNEVDRPNFDGNSKAISSPATRRSNRRSAHVDTIGRNYTGKPDLSDDNRSGKAGERFFGEVPQVSGGNPNNLLVINPPVADGTSPQVAVPKMRRFWISPWVDRDNAYNGEQLLFVDIESEHWKNGSKTQGENPIFNPLN
jgi:hypothetical protein